MISFLSDTWADLQYPYPGDNTSAPGNSTSAPGNNTSTPGNNTSAPGNNVYGNIKQLYLLKKKNRTLKTLLSIGGWSYRANFPPMLASEEYRQNFVDSAVEFVANLGFDGIDIDYEYVTGQDQAEQMVDLLRRLRSGLNNLANSIKASSPFLISYCSPAGKAHYSQLDFAGMTPYLDYYNFMAVDYMGPSFSNYSGFLSNLYPDVTNLRATDFNTNSGIVDYIRNHIPPKMIIMENPLYGRSFNGTDGMGDKFSNAGTLGSLGQTGVLNYKDLPLPGFNATVVNVPRIGGSYSYAAQNRYLVSYDTPEIARAKADYVRLMGLGGTAWWELSMDRNDTLSLISNTVSQLGGTQALDKTLNNLNYPTSTYTNLRSGFPGE